MSQSQQGQHPTAATPPLHAGKGVGQQHPTAATPPLLERGRGSDMVLISPDPINQQLITDHVTDPSAGAVSLFIGTTRNHFEGKQVLELRYEAYVEMALKQLRGICDSLREKWNICRAAIVHRIGVVPVGEASVLIAVSSTHRHDSLAAVQYAIEAIKESAVIWKKEIYSDDQRDGEWKVNKECSWGSEKGLPLGPGK